VHARIAPMDRPAADRSGTGERTIGLGLAGFTLVELVIAIAVVAILMAIAVPAYTDYVVRTNRTEAIAALSNTAQALERCFTRFNTYNAGACPVALPDTTEGGRYVITGAINAAAFVLTATPQGSQASRDGECANFTLTHAGVRGISGSGSVADCW
jgi:type IV pilus assembly protein PilE